MVIAVDHIPTPRPHIDIDPDLHTTRAASILGSAAGPIPLTATLEAKNGVVSLREAEIKKAGSPPSLLTPRTRRKVLRRKRRMKRSDKLMN